jgi:hypothetical protein
VEHETGTTLVGATVTLANAAGGVPDVRSQISGAGGTFFFPAVPPGLYVLSAALLGYTELRDTLRVVAASDIEATLPLSVSAIPLEPVVVVVRRHYVGPLVGFELRRRTLRGTFLARSDIDSANPVEFTDLLRSVPGVRLLPTSTFGYDVRFRGGCIPDLWLDGAQVGSTVDIDSFLQPEDLEAVEVYRGPELPAEFGTNLCGAIVAWTRRGGPTPEKRSLGKQLIFAASFLLVVLVTR